MRISPFSQQPQHLLRGLFPIQRFQNESEVKGSLRAELQDLCLRIVGEGDGMEKLVASVFQVGADVFEGHFPHCLGLTAGQKQDQDY